MPETACIGSHSIIRIAINRRTVRAGWDSAAYSVDGGAGAFDGDQPTAFTPRVRIGSTPKGHRSSKCCAPRQTWHDATRDRKVMRVGPAVAGIVLVGESMDFDTFPAQVQTFVAPTGPAVRVAGEHIQGNR